MVGSGPPASTSAPAIIPGRDRAAVVTYGVLLAVTAAAWAHMLGATPGSHDMAGADMAPTLTWSAGLGYVTAWGVMMTAMMLPSALPMIGLFAATRRPAERALGRALPVAVFTLVYVGLWALTGAPIYLASVALDTLAGEAQARVVAGVLVVAGAFQLSPLKQVCLRHCRSPLGFFLGHWRAGWRGTLSLGAAHAAYCLGCCWALMIVLVAAGAMGLAWVLLVTAVVAAEKLSAGGEWVARVTGAALILLGALVAIRPDLLAALRAGGHSM